MQRAKTYDTEICISVTGDSGSGSVPIPSRTNVLAEFGFRYDAAPIIRRTLEGLGKVI